MKTKGPTWQDVKKHISGFGQKEIFDLIRDMYHLSADNKTFLHTRFSLGSDPLEHYKRIIQRALDPDIEKNEDIYLKDAKEAIRSYAKAVDNPAGEAELMVFYVECGNNFTLNYGDVDEEFYDALIDMYELAIETVQELPVDEQEIFKDRLYEIMDEVSDIGWGYYDSLAGLYGQAFPTTD